MQSLVRWPLRRRSVRASPDDNRTNRFVSLPQINAERRDRGSDGEAAKRSVATTQFGKVNEPALWTG
jgi:hypothetical protein